MRILGVVGVSLFIALFGRLWYLQALQAEELQEVATLNIQETIRTQAPRGRVLDINGNVLVDNRLSTIVTVNPEDLRIAELEARVRTDGVKAVLLATSERSENQAFHFPGVPIYCTQFHPELDRAGFRFIDLQRLARNRVWALRKAVKIDAPRAREVGIANLLTKPLDADQLAQWLAAEVGG